MEMTLRPMTQAEQAYCYTQSHQICSHTGLIGHLRTDFGSSGTEFFSTFFDFRENLKSDDFKAEFDDVINALRSDPQYGGILKSRGAMSSYCYKHPESTIEFNYNYGFRVDTDHYSYMLRATPKKGEYNLYCYCYVRQWLDRHMNQAAKGIRIITSGYTDLFRIADGDRIRLTMENDETREMTCRYLDDYHIETIDSKGSSVYHIGEFVSVWKQHGCQEMIPIRKSLPDTCFSFLESTGEVIVIRRGEKGYTPTGQYAETVSPRDGVDALNQANGITKAQEAAMVAGSMFGWDKPAADPSNYDENGILLSKKQKERGDAR